MASLLCAKFQLESPQSHQLQLNLKNVSEFPGWMRATWLHHHSEPLSLHSDRGDLAGEAFACVAEARTGRDFEISGQIRSENLSNSTILSIPGR